MPCNEKLFEATRHCLSEFKRVWVDEDKKKVFKPYAVDKTGVYHITKGLGCLDDFETILLILENCLSERLID